MSRFTMELKVLAGTSIEDVVEEAKKKAALFDLAYVEFSFNGVQLSIGRNADVEYVVQQYDECVSGLYTRGEKKSDNCICEP